MALKGSKTEENLKAAFAGESQANRRYLYFAQKADVEGYNDVATVFRSTAEGETGHAHGHLEFLEEVGNILVKASVRLNEDRFGSAFANSGTFLNEMSFTIASNTLLVPEVKILTKNYKQTLAGNYAGDFNPIYISRTINRVTDFVRISKANFTCENGVLSGSLEVKGQTLIVQNGICDKENVEFDLRNIPLNKTGTEEPFIVSGRAVAKTITHRHVGLEICGIDENYKCLPISFFRK